MIRKITLFLMLILVSHQATAACWPFDDPEKIKVGTVSASVSTRYSHYVMWGCLSPRGAWTRVYLTSPSEFTGALMTPRTQAAADAELARNAPIPATAPEDAFIVQLQSQFGVAALVTGAATTTRPTYPLNADRTRGTTATGKRVAGGTRCNHSLRATGTGYYSVKGQTATDGTVLGDVVAVCTLTSGVGLNVTD